MMETMDDRKKSAADMYFKVLDRLDSLRKSNASDFEIECAKIEEIVAWEDVKKVMGPNAYCR